jgi:phenylpropionate dioxygenase-like ring-hydroxylating dioxygenase large terminal subunit
MTEHVQMLRMPYGAYLHRGLPAEDIEITHVTPNSPCGEYLRRFWQPVAFSDELRELPKRIKILDEDLVVFRDGQKRVGVLQLHCCHRGSSLEFGRIAQQGIRCCYHGWHFDIDGTILETPGEPQDSRIKERLYQGAYPALEYGGLVFAYMGPPDRKPPFPILDTYILPGFRLVPTVKNILPCNWLQAKENSMDPVHTTFLHTRVSGVQFTQAYEDVGALDWMETPVGLIYIHTRRYKDNVWVHMNDFIPPNIHQFPPTWEDAEREKRFQRPMITLWNVPIDNTTTMNIGFRHINENMSEEERTRLKSQQNSLEGEGFGQNGNRPYEERQRVPGDFDAQVSQRPIAVHALEHQGSTDRGIVMLRKILREGARDVAAGRDPKFLSRREGDVHLTYSNDTILRIPQRPTPEEDLKLLFETGRKIAQEFLESHPDKALASAAKA